MESNTETLPVIKDSIANNPAWFNTWFDTFFYHQLYGHRNEKEAADFIDNLLMEMQPPQGSRMLDLGCGAGRHAKHLASKGFDVTGLDLAASSIREARKFEKINLHFMRHDMREPFGNNQFDYVFNFFTSFGYFNLEEENNKVIANMAAALRQGGYLVIDYINSVYSEERLIPSEKKEIDGMVYHITRWMDEKNFYKKINIENLGPGKSYDYIEQVAKFNIDEFNKMFLRNGLQLQNVFGNYNLDGFNNNSSPRLILLAKKNLPNSK